MHVDGGKGIAEHRDVAAYFDTCREDAKAIVRRGKR